jgi:hypothetical protein
LRSDWLYDKRVVIVADCSKPKLIVVIFNLLAYNHTKGIQINNMEGWVEDV